MLPMASYERFSPALSLPTGKEMVDIIDSRVRQGGGTWRATVVDVNSSGWVRVRRPGQSEPEAKYSPVVGASPAPTSGSDVLMVGGAGGDVYCLGVVGASETGSRITGRLSQYSHGLFAGNIGGLMSSGHCWVSSSVSDDFLSDLYLGPKSLTVDVALDAGGTAVAIVTCPVWPASTDILTLEVLDEPLSVPANAPHDAYEISHRVVDVQPDMSLDDWFPRRWECHAIDLAIGTIGTDSHYVLPPSNLDGEPHYDAIRLEGGWYRFWLSFTLVDIIYNSEIRLGVHDAAGGRGSIVAGTLIDESLAMIVGPGQTGEYVAGHMEGLFAISSDEVPGYYLAVGIGEGASDGGLAIVSAGFERVTASPRKFYVTPT